MTNERDKVAQLYDEAKEELRAARCELVKCSSKTSNASLAAQAILKRIENERDSAIFDLKNTANERDSYRERLRMTNEAAIKDKACFEQQIDDLESRQRNVSLILLIIESIDKLACLYSWSTTKKSCVNRSTCFSSK